MTRAGKILSREVDAYLAFWIEVERKEEVVTIVTTARFVVVNNNR